MSKPLKCSIVFLIVFLMAGCSGLQMRPDIKPDLEGRISRSGLDIDLDANDAVDVAYGGTNATSAADARTNLGLGTAAVAATGDFEAAGAVTSHAGASDPHTGYMLESNIGTGANNYPKLGATPGTPDGTKFYRDDNTWAVPSGEVLSTAVLWDAAGDLVQGTGANTAAKLTKGAQGTILQAGASTNAWSAYTLPATVPTVGKTLISDGTNLIGSTALGSAAYANTGDFQPAGTSTPGGSTTQVQYNNAGVFGGIANFTYDGTTFTLNRELALGASGSISGIGALTMGGVVLGDSTPDAAGEVGFDGTDKYSFFGANSEDFYFRVGSSANTVLFGSGTGVTDIDLGSFNLATTGKINGAVPIVTDADGMTLSAAQAYGTFFVAGGAGTWNLPAAVEGMAVCIYSTTAAAVVVNPDDSDVITLDGTALSAGDGITSASGAGDFVSLIAVSGSSWLVIGRSGTWTDTN